jgi:hypothetical protein
MRRSRELLYQTETQKLELLNTPINQLGLKVKGTIFEQAIASVKEEMKLAGICKLEPVFYISTGYGCIAGSPIISLGFYDFHPLLKELNQEVRGWFYTDAEIYDLLRHEVGHAFCYSYKLYRTPEFRSLFNVEGNFFNTYPDDNDYWYNPWSRSFVNPNGDHYAQKHPDEDFAETFCVWLTPRSGWRKNYKGRPTALKKLRYADHAIKALGSQPPFIETNLNWMYERVDDIKMTVAEFLNAKTKPYKQQATGYVDPDLKELFRAAPRGISRRALFKDFMRADQFIRQQKQSLLTRISYWVGVDTRVAADVLDKCIARARALNLWLEQSQHEKKLIEFTTYITTLCANYKNSGFYMSN